MKADGRHPRRLPGPVPGPSKRSSPGADIQQTLDKYNEVEQQVIDQMLEG